MRNIIHLATDARETLVDITEQVRAVVKASGVRNGLVSVYAQGATAAILIQENWDESVQTDVVNFLRQLIPKGVGGTAVNEGPGSVRSASAGADSSRGNRGQQAGRTDSGLESALARAAPLIQGPIGLASP